MSTTTTTWTIEISACNASHYEEDALVTHVRRVRVIDASGRPNAGRGFETAPEADAFAEGARVGLFAAGLVAGVVDLTVPSEPDRIPCECGDGSCVLCDDGGMRPVDDSDRGYEWPADREDFHADG